MLPSVHCPERMKKFFYSNKGSNSKHVIDFPHFQTVIRLSFTSRNMCLQFCQCSSMNKKKIGTYNLLVKSLTCIGHFSGYWSICQKHDRLRGGEDWVLPQDMFLWLSKIIIFQQQHDRRTSRLSLWAIVTFMCCPPLLLPSFSLWRDIAVAG